MFVHFIISLRETGLNEERRHICVRRVTKWNYSYKILCSLLSCILIEKATQPAPKNFSLPLSGCQVTFKDNGRRWHFDTFCTLNLNVLLTLTFENDFQWTRELFSSLLIIWKKKLPSWCYVCILNKNKVNFMLALPKSYRLQMEKN